jgi:hypothetical protein
MTDLPDGHAGLARRYLIEFCDKTGRDPELPFSL